MLPFSLFKGTHNEPCSAPKVSTEIPTVKLLFQDGSRGQAEGAGAQAMMALHALAISIAQWEGICTAEWLVPGILNQYFWPF